MAISYSITYIPRLKEIIETNNFCYLELCDKLNKPFNVFSASTPAELNDILQSELNSITSGEIIINVSPSKKLFSKGISIPMNISAAPIGSVVTSDTKLELELFKQQIKHEEEVRELKAAENFEADEENEFSEIDKWLNHPVIGKILTPALENNGDKIATLISGFIDGALGVNKNAPAQLSGLTTNEQRVKDALGSIQYNIVMSALADMLEKDPAGTIDKIKKIFL